MERKGKEEDKEDEPPGPGRESLYSRETTKIKNEKRRNTREI